jgi:hypothetical protein
VLFRSVEGLFPERVEVGGFDVGSLVGLELFEREIKERHERSPWLV